MMAFRDYDAVARPEFLTLPIGGKAYAIRPIGARDGIRLKLATTANPDQPLQDAATKADVTAPLGDDELLDILLGPVRAEMEADNVPADAVLRAAMTALADYEQGRTVAEAVWESGAVPERLAAYMAAKQEGLPDSTPSPSTAAGSKTRSRARSSGTTSPKTTPRKPPAKTATKRTPPPGRP